MAVEVIRVRGKTYTIRTGSDVVNREAKIQAGKEAYATLVRKKTGLAEFQGRLKRRSVTPSVVKGTTAEKVLGDVSILEPTSKASKADVLYASEQNKLEIKGYNKAIDRYNASQIASYEAAVKAQADQLNKRESERRGVEAFRALIDRNTGQSVQTESVFVKDKKGVISRIKEQFTPRTLDSVSVSNLPGNLEKFKVSNFGLTPEESLNIIEKAETRLRIAQGSNIQKAILSDKTGEPLLRQLVVAPVLGAGRGALGVVKATAYNPKEFIVQNVQSILRPRQTFEGIKQDFKIDPLGTIAEFSSFMGGFKTIGRGFKSGIGEPIVEELYLSTKPAAERPFLRAIIESARVQEGLVPVNPKSIKIVNFFDVEKLSVIEAKALKKAIGQSDSVVFGSKAGRLLSGGLTKIPKDVDIATANAKSLFSAFRSNLPKSKRGDYVLKGEKVVNVVSGEKLFDAKPLSRLIQNKNLLTGRGLLPVTGLKFFKVKKGKVDLYGSPTESSILDFSTQPLAKVGGLKFVSFSEQTTRKGLGSIQVILEKNSRRAKDPAGFVEGLRVQLRSLKKEKSETLFDEAIRLRKIGVLEKNIKILSSDVYQKFLESKVGLKAREFPVNELKDLKVGKGAKFLGERIARKRQKKSSDLSDSKIPRVIGSYIPVGKSSLIPSGRSSFIPLSEFSSLPSRTPTSPVSNIPYVPPSVIPSVKPYNIPSVTPTSPVSNIPYVPPSVIPSVTPSRVPSITPSRIPSVISQKVIPPVLKIRSIQSLKSKSLNTGFGVEVRERGRFKRLGGVFSQQDASRFGRYVVDNSVAATFRVVPASGSVRSLRDLKSFPSKFRVKGKNFIERRSYRIDSLGEVAGLSAARVASRVLKGSSKSRNRRVALVGQKFLKGSPVVYSLKGVVA